jgi:DNA-binding response OmpR family regulator
VLSRAGYKVFCARDGETAIELFTQNRDKIDLAVLDVVMPIKDGRQVHDAIKEFSPDFRVLFSSGYNGNAIHTNFVLHEGMQLLQKPFTTDELLRKVRALLDAEKPSKQ